MMILAILAAVTAPTCDGAADCSEKWSRAAQWVQERNPTIVQFTDSLIVTGEPLGRTNKYQVTRINGTITLALACAALRSCKRDEMKREFYDAVMRPEK